MKLAGWIQTYTGKKFWPLDPRPEDVDIVDIAHALSMQCRFGGHCLRFYSTAEHSVYVSHHCGSAALIGLLHDGSEAYLLDMLAPIKEYMPDYKAAEKRCQAAVYRAFACLRSRRQASRSPIGACSRPSACRSWVPRPSRG